MEKFSTVPVRAAYTMDQNDRNIVRVAAGGSAGAPRIRSGPASTAAGRRASPASPRTGASPRTSPSPSRSSASPKHTSAAPGGGVVARRTNPKRMSPAKLGPRRAGAARTSPAPPSAKGPSEMSTATVHTGQRFALSTGMPGMHGPSVHPHHTGAAPSSSVSTSGAMPGGSGVVGSSAAVGGPAAADRSYVRPMPSHADSRSAAPAARMASAQLRASAPAAADWASAQFASTAARPLGGGRGVGTGIGGSSSATMTRSSPAYGLGARPLAGATLHASTPAGDLYRDQGPAPGVVAPGDRAAHGVATRPRSSGSFDGTTLKPAAAATAAAPVPRPNEPMWVPAAAGWDHAAPATGAARREVPVPPPVPQHAGVAAHQSSPAGSGTAETSDGRAPPAVPAVQGHGTGAVVLESVFAGIMQQFNVTREGAGFILQSALLEQAAHPAGAPDLGTNATSSHMLVHALAVAQAQAARAQAEAVANAATARLVLGEQLSASDIAALSSGTAAGVTSRPPAPPPGALSPAAFGSPGIPLSPPPQQAAVPASTTAAPKAGAPTGGAAAESGAGDKGTRRKRRTKRRSKVGSSHRRTKSHGEARVSDLAAAVLPTAVAPNKAAAGGAVRPASNGKEGDPERAPSNGAPPRTAVGSLVSGFSNLSVVVPEEHKTTVAHHVGDSGARVVSGADQIDIADDEVQSLVNRASEGQEQKQTGTMEKSAGTGSVDGGVASPLLGSGAGPGTPSTMRSLEGGARAPDERMFGSEKTPIPIPHFEDSKRRHDTYSSRSERGHRSSRRSRGSRGSHRRGQHGTARVRDSDRRKKHSPAKSRSREVEGHRHRARNPRGYRGTPESHVEQYEQMQEEVRKRRINAAESAGSLIFSREALGDTGDNGTPIDATDLSGEVAAASTPRGAAGSSSTPGPLANAPKAPSGLSAQMKFPAGTVDGASLVATEIEGMSDSAAADAKRMRESREKSPRDGDVSRSRSRHATPDGGGSGRERERTSERHSPRHGHHDHGSRERREYRSGSSSRSPSRSASVPRRRLPDSVLHEVREVSDEDASSRDHPRRERRERDREHRDRDRDRDRDRGRDRDAERHRSSRDYDRERRHRHSGSRSHRHHRSPERRHRSSAREHGSRRRRTRHEGRHSSHRGDDYHRSRRRSLISDTSSAFTRSSSGRHGERSSHRHHRSRREHGRHQSSRRRSSISDDVLDSISVASSRYRHRRRGHHTSDSATTVSSYTADPIRRVRDELSVHGGASPDRSKSSAVGSARSAFTVTSASVFSEDEDEEDAVRSRY